MAVTLNLSVAIGTKGSVVKVIRSEGESWQRRHFRERIAQEAARLLLNRPGSDYRNAIRRAARMFNTRLPVDELPTPREVREHLHRLEATAFADAFQIDPKVLRLEAVRLMRRLRRFVPRLAPVDAAEPEIRLRVHSDDFECVTDVLREMGLAYTVQPARQGFGSDSFTPILVHRDLPCRLSVFAADQRDAKWISPSSGELVESLGLEELERLLSDDGTPAELDSRLEGLSMDDDRFELFRYLLERLESVRQDRARHPEGDVLHHSLQVFDLALAERPFDEEFLTAALLHDVGKLHDTVNPSAASIIALEGAVTHRTRWLIQNLPAATDLKSGKLRPEQRQVLRASEDFDDLVLLCELDAKGRVPGMATSNIDVALGHLKTLDAGGY